MNTLEASMSLGALQPQYAPMASSEHDGRYASAVDLRAASEQPTPSHLGNLAFAMERGDLLVVRYLLSRDGEVAYAAIVPPAHLKAWLQMAQAHEDLNGPESFLDPNHRFNKELLPVLRAKTGKEHDLEVPLPGTSWSMELGWHN